MSLIANCRLPDLFNLSVTQSEARDMVKSEVTRNEQTALERRRRGSIA